MLEAWGNLGATAILGALALWATRWLPRFAERTLERHDDALKAFQAELGAERDACREQLERMAERFDGLREGVTETHRNVEELRRDVRETLETARRVEVLSVHGKRAGG